MKLHSQSLNMFTWTNIFPTWK